MGDYLEDPEYREDISDDDEPGYYVCLSCGYTQTEKPDGFGCPRCTANAFDPVYF